MDTKSILFLVIMIAIGVAGLVAFLVYLYARFAAARRDRQRLPSGGGTGDGGTGSGFGGEGGEGAASVRESPPGVRLLGLLLLGASIGVLAWLHLPLARQYPLMLQLVYPAALAVSLVLLFDKATRAWGRKGGAESYREWLFCDGLVFLLLLGYLNLSALAEGEKYNALFWDLLGIVLYLFVFWLLDRRATRYRFLVAYAYLLLLPILLLIWGAVLGLPAAEGVFWWGTIWPFFFWALIFAVLEIIQLIATQQSEGQIVGAVKDTAFFIVYAILLIVAIS